MTDESVERARLARSLVRGSEAGVLATMSSELPGYPFGSVTPFVLLHDGQLAIYVSSIAQHTKNAAADPKVCLTVVEAGAEDQQALGRVSVVGDAAVVPEDRLADVQERYWRLYPAARGYAGTHDFAFWWIEPVRVRYIGGFGRIGWVEPDAWRGPAPEWRADEDGIVAHMNDDHRDALRRIVTARHGGRADAVEMLALDVDGFHVRADEQTRWIPFDAPCATAADVRAAMVRLAR